MEARILCGTVVPNDTPLVSDDPAFSGESPSEKSKSPDHQSRLEYWTWKLSGRVGMSYKTMNPHRRNNHRHPLPFPRSSAESSIPLEPCASTAGLLMPETLDTKNLSRFTDEPIHESPVEEENPGPFDDTRTALVTNHPPHPVWNDDSNPDTPYDNPYYTRSISDTLWLPRNPLGILDLDDTVDLRMSLTSEPSAGKLGAWQEDEFLSSAIESVLATSFGSVDADSVSIYPSGQVDNSEVSATPVPDPSHISSTSRLQTSDIVPSPRPSLPSPRRLSVTNSERDRPAGLRRPTPLRDRRSSSGFRSFSLGEDTFTRPPSSHLSVPPMIRQRSSSVDALSVGPHSIAQPYLSPGSATLRSVIRMPGMRVPSGAPSQGAASVVSVRETVVSEAIAEEHLAAQQRQRQEQADEEKAKEPRSWLTSWIYSKGK